MEINTVLDYHFDLKYLANNMSCDAAPALYAFAEEVGYGTYDNDSSEDTKYAMYLRSYFHDVSYEYDKHDEIREFNLSWYRAHLYAERYLD